MFFLQCNVLNACWIIRSFVPQIIKKTICHNVLSLLPWSKWDTLKTSSKLYIGNTSPWWKKWKLFLSFSRKEIAIWEVRSFQKFKWLHYLKHFHSIEPKVNISNKTRTPEIFCSCRRVCKNHSFLSTVCVGRQKWNHDNYFKNRTCMQCHVEL